MYSTRTDFKKKISHLVRQWGKEGLPGRDTLIKTGESLLRWKHENNIKGLWQESSHFVTATLDDAWGHGLDLIELYAKVMGLHVVRLGLMMSAEEIISVCTKLNPKYLGMTVLQFDAEDDLVTIGHNLPETTQLIVGGPIFKADPDIAAHADVTFVAKDVAAFVDYFLSGQL